MLIIRQVEVLLFQRVSLEGEDQIHGRDLFFDDTPFVDSTGTLHQDPIDAQRYSEDLVVRHDIRLELEGPLGPLEYPVDRLFDLYGDVLVELVLRESPHVYENRSEHLLLVTLM